MLLLILRRFGQMALVMIVVSILLFLILEIDPVSVAIKVLGPYSSDEQRQIWLEQNGYFQPLYVRYFEWVIDMVTGDLGQSIRFKTPVADVLWPRLVNTAILGGVAMAIIVPLSLFLGVLASPSFAQVAVTGGVKGGVNLADVSFDPEDPGFPCCGMKAGGVFGAFVNVGTPTVSFQPELLYSMKGAKGSDAAEDARIKVNFVEIPLLLRADPMSENQVHPFVTIGPAVSFRTSAKFEDPSGQEEDLEDTTKSTDFGMIFGGGIAAGPATIELRYDLGLRDLNDDPTEDLKVKSRTLSILFGISFGR
jgi:hypothetical protein